MSYDYPNVFLPTEGKDFPQYGAKEVHGGIIMGGDKLSHERKASGIGQASSMSYSSDSWSSIPSSPVSLGYYSDVKNPQTSAVSYLSENCLSIPPSPVSNIGYYPDFGDPEPKPTTSDPYENSRPSNPRSSQQFYSSDGYFQQPEDLKHTPSSLGWIPKLELFKLYKFVVPKGQLPYLELLEKWTPTYDTPSRVYLDEPK
jgi:hypothetical protein